MDLALQFASTDKLITKETARDLKILIIDNTIQKRRKSPSVTSFQKNLSYWEVELWNQIKTY